MSIIKAYRYLFYRTYTGQLKAFGESNNPQLVAVLLNSSCLGFNLFTLFVWFQLITNQKMRVENSYPVALMIVIMLINRFYFLSGNRFQKVIEEFTPESDLQRKNRGIWYWGYVIFSYLVFIVSCFFLPYGSK